MSGRAPELATGLTRGWVSLYTRGLPPDLRTSRREELESDLWEHEHSSTTEGRRSGQVALEIVERLFAGAAADLSWRLEHRDSRRHATRPLGGGTMIGLLKNNGMVALTGALGVTTTSLAIGAAVFGDVEAAGGRWLVAIFFLAGPLILGGLIAVRRGLRGGRLAVALGTIVPGIGFYWTVIMPIVTLAILIWLFGGFQLRRSPVQPA